MHYEYRGHRIRLTQHEPWRAEFVELASGTTLPTMIVAHPDESLRELWVRARRLVDLYLDVPSAPSRQLGPVRPWQVIPAGRLIARAG